MCSGIWLRNAFARRERPDGATRMARRDAHGATRHEEHTKTKGKSKKRSETNKMHFFQESNIFPIGLRWRNVFVLKLTGGLNIEQNKEAAHVVQLLLGMFRLFEIQRAMPGCLEFRSN